MEPCAVHRERLRSGKGSRFALHARVLSLAHRLAGEKGGVASRVRPCSDKSAKLVGSRGDGFNLDGPVMVYRGPVRGGSARWQAARQSAAVLAVLAVHCCRCASLPNGPSLIRPFHLPDSAERGAAGLEDSSFFSRGGGVFFAYLQGAGLFREPLPCKPCRPRLAAPGARQARAATDTPMSGPSHGPARGRPSRPSRAPARRKERGIINCKLCPAESSSRTSVVLARQIAGRAVTRPFPGAVECVI